MFFLPPPAFKRNDRRFVGERPERGSEGKLNFHLKTNRFAKTFQMNMNSPHSCSGRNWVHKSWHNPTFKELSYIIFCYLTISRNKVKGENRRLLWQWHVWYDHLGSNFMKDAALGVVVRMTRSKRSLFESSLVLYSKPTVLFWLTTTFATFVLNLICTFSRVSWFVMFRNIVCVKVSVPLTISLKPCIMRRKNVWNQGKGRLPPPIVQFF